MAMEDYPDSFYRRGLELVAEMEGPRWVELIEGVADRLFSNYYAHRTDPDSQCCPHCSYFREFSEMYSRAHVIVSCSLLPLAIDVGLDEVVWAHFRLGLCREGTTYEEFRADWTDDHVKFLWLVQRGRESWEEIQRLSGLTWWTTAETAWHLYCTPANVRGLLARGRLVGRRPGNRDWLIQKESVYRYEDEHRLRNRFRRRSA